VIDVAENHVFVKRSPAVGVTERSKNDNCRDRKSPVGRRGLTSETMSDDMSEHHRERPPAAQQV